MPTSPAGPRRAGPSATPRRLALCVLLWVVLMCLVVFGSFRTTSWTVPTEADASHHAAKHSRGPAGPPQAPRGTGNDGSDSECSASGMDKKEHRMKNTPVTARGDTQPDLDAATPNACSDASTCLACLFPFASSAAMAKKSDCVWCASARRCIPAAQRDACGDVEAAVCPAILHTTPPQTIRVIHVAIRKGGPEALVQMHLGLVHWGFKTSLDTRRSKKQKGGEVVPFFKEMYAEEFAKAPPLRWSANYDAWLDSAAEGDVLLATETWLCRNDINSFLKKGARQMQWHLTVWPKKNRAGCTIAAHTNHIAQDYMAVPRRAVLFPYISPHIVALAQKGAGSWMKQKKDIVMYDGDVKMTDADLKPLVLSGGKVDAWQAKLSDAGNVASRLKEVEVRKATGFTPADLYAMYGKSKVGIDLVLPGAERFVYEAALFDVCIIVDDTANGADRTDLPLPDRFRVAPNDKAALHERVAECLLDHDKAVKEQAPLKAHVLAQRTNFLRHVRRYYSNSVHVVTVFRSADAVRRYFRAFILHTLIAIPFATIEVQLARGVAVDEALMKPLLSHSLLAAVLFTEFSSPKGLAGVTPTTNAKRVAYVLVVGPDTWLLSGDVVHGLGSLLAASGSLKGGVPATAVVGDGFALSAAAAWGGKTAPFAGCPAAAQKANVDNNGNDVSATTPLRDGLKQCVAKDAWLLNVDEPVEPLTADFLHRRGLTSPQLATRAAAGSEKASGITAPQRRFLCSHPLYAKLLPAQCEGVDDAHGAPADL